MATSHHTRRVQEKRSATAKVLTYNEESATRIAWGHKECPEEAARSKQVKDKRSHRPRQPQRLKQRLEEAAESKRAKSTDPSCRPKQQERQSGIDTPLSSSENSLIFTEIGAGLTAFKKNVRIQLHRVQRDIETVATVADYQEPIRRIRAIENTIRQFTGYYLEPLEGMGRQRNQQTLDSTTSVPDGMSLQKDQNVQLETEPAVTFRDRLKASRMSLHPVQLSSDEQLKKQMCEIPTPVAAAEQDEVHWRRDLKKCLLGNEAIYQHTIMMACINRHGLEEFDTTLDYHNELEWRSEKPPASHLKRRLPAPRPDLCIGFRPQVFYDAYPLGEWTLPPELEPCMIPERCPHDGDPGRAFPFLILQVKGSSSDVGGTKAFTQSLNDGIHALYNMWKFMRLKETLRRRFFERVRIFTAGGHSKEFRVRIHRAIEIGSDQDRLPQGYPLKFQFDDVLTLEGESYTQARVRAVLYRIMRWGIEELLPDLIDAFKEACKQEPKKRTEPSGSSQPPTTQNGLTGDSPLSGSRTPTASNPHQEGPGDKSKRPKTSNRSSESKGGHSLSSVASSTRRATRQLRSTVISE